MRNGACGLIVWARKAIEEITQQMKGEHNKIEKDKIRFRLDNRAPEHPIHSRLFLGCDRSMNRKQAYNFVDWFDLVNK